MRRTKLYSLVALTLSVIVPNRQIARAQSTGLADTLSVKPVMMLLVDTSGSMERMPDSSGCVDCLPSCTNSAADSTQKNRWAVTLEALTGSFNTFRCVEKLRSTYTGQYDQDYFLSHYDFTGSPAQASDGVMDSFRNQVKFGLMTFDGVSTTINGTTLVPQATYNSDATFKAQILGMEGQYSYPDVYASPSTNPALSTPLDAYGWKPLSFPGCTSVYGVNAGARGKGTLPGSLISVGPTDVGTDVTGTNDSIQTSLLQIRPYGGTPIAGMLDDLRYYLTNDTDVKQGSDPYYSCRQRFAILLTDGAPDTLFRNDARFQCESSNDAACSSGVCQCPYDTETNLATALTTRDGLKKLYLVAFNVNDTAALTTLDAIALAGNTTSAYRANNLSALRTQLTTILQGTASPATSRSVPTIVNT
ncbi:MAG: Type fimbrial biosis protein PilY1, partial [Myxococcaceae bacterium]|nr:Type fimbrial biosis protein PilY1 [Myxococcaceae bacterium]